ncbi:hypothetical protein K3U94_00125 [Mycolicibacter heraklionensis]|uniref:Uncharacterized protein n=1 Tax=Mycolicibacter heraklionensis TaxID=512402 RepID=A0A9X7ZGS0_9MYCO|nr:hypothetical protein [Mycolicibacter heraklionensis]QZA07822.1 hypothetical protein K3U94_00125 [Mycolicibacter heraklionensis]
MGQAARNLYAHGSATLPRKFLYEEPSPLNEVTIKLPDPGPMLRTVIEDAVNRLNGLRAGLLSPDCGQHDLAPADAASINAIWAIWVIRPRIPAQIFPLAGGGIQIEWHHGGLDIEIECLADDSLYIYLALNESGFIDEEARGPRIVELLRGVGKELDNATAGYGGEQITFYS